MPISRLIIGLQYRTCITYTGNKRVQVRNQRKLHWDKINARKVQKLQTTRYNDAYRLR